MSACGIRKYVKAIGYISVYKVAYFIRVVHIQTKPKLFTLGGGLSTVFRENIEYLTNSGLENLLKLGEAFASVNLEDSDK